MLFRSGADAPQNLTKLRTRAAVARASWSAGALSHPYPQKPLLDMGSFLRSILSGIRSEVELTGFVPGLLGGRTFSGVLFFDSFPLHEDTQE